MGKTRYKIRKEQLERVVENFVMESAAPEVTKHVKGSTPSESKGNSTSSMKMKMKQSSEAKKHKMSMGAEQADDMGDGMKKAPESKSMKMRQAPEAKKHVKGSVSESNLRTLIRIAESKGISEAELMEELAILAENKESFMSNLNMKKRSQRALISKGRISGEFTAEDEADLVSQAEEDGYRGDLKINPKSGKIEYIPQGKVTQKGSLLSRLGGSVMGKKYQSGNQ
jgi:hypothetical protein